MPRDGTPDVPELPEVESTRRSLLPIVGGRAVGVDLRRRDIVEGPRDPASLLVGSRVVALHRHGKQLAIEGEHAVVLVHLGMTGRLEFSPKLTGSTPVIALHTHVRWTLDSGVLTFRDPRRFGGLWTLPSMNEVRARWAMLGPDALAVTGDELTSAMRTTRRTIKSALLDQALVAGVGNIYADEALFRASIRPTRSAQRIPAACIETLATVIHDVLNESIGSGGSTLRDYRDASGRVGQFQSRHRVYGRGGEPCLTCGTRLTQCVVAQRTTVYCRRCQP